MSPFVSEKQRRYLWMHEPKIAKKWSHKYGSKPIKSSKKTMAKKGFAKYYKRVTGKKAKLGTGARFKALKGKLAKKGAKKPGALAAWIGRRKYGAKRFAKLSAKGR